MKLFVFPLALILMGSALFFAHAATDVERGRQIYFQGKSFDGHAFTANVGAAAIAVPATALPCAGCHGRDGRGRPEGGVKPSNIEWDNLTRSYGGTSKSGRSFKTYDETSFLHAVTEGRDSSGNKLDTSMPRFNISKQDALDLIAYLKVIRNDYDPGVSDDQIVIATLLPETTAQKGLADAASAVIRARMQEINRQGGIYGRKLSLEVVGYRDQQSFVGRASDLISADRAFALLSPFSARADATLTEMVEQAEIPSIAPFTQFPSAEGGRHLYTFYLYGGLDMQVSALVQRLLNKTGRKSTAAVLSNANGHYADQAKLAIDKLTGAGTNASAFSYDVGQANPLPEILDKSDEDSGILFIGAAAELKQLIDKLSPQQQQALGDRDFYLPGFFVTSQIMQLPQSLLQRLDMAYLTVPGNRDKPLTEFMEFMRRNQLDFRFVNVQLFAYSAMKTLEEGIKRSGKRLTRKKLVDAIEGLYEFDAGLNQLISFGSRRRTGLKGAFIVSMSADGKGLGSNQWIKIND